MSEIQIKQQKPEYVSNGDLSPMCRLTSRSLQLKVRNGEIEPEAFLLQRSGRRVALWTVGTATKLRELTKKG